MIHFYLLFFKKDLFARFQTRCIDFVVVVKSLVDLEFTLLLVLELHFDTYFIFYFLILF